MSDSPLLYLGSLSKPHGLKGDLKLRAYVEDASFLKGKFCFLSNNPYSPKFLIIRCQLFKPGLFLLTLQDIKDRTQAETYSGRDVYINRTDLPVLPDEDLVFYETDLRGTPVHAQDGTPLGVLIAIENFGAGDVCIIQDEHGYEGMIPFHHDHITAVEPQKSLTVSPLGQNCFELNKPSSSKNRALSHKTV